MGIISRNPQAEWTTAQVTVTLTPVSSDATTPGGVQVVTSAPSNRSDTISSDAGAARRAEQRTATRGSTR